MKLLRSIISSLPPVGLLALQLSCGGGSDSSGPPSAAAANITANSSVAFTAPPGAPVTELPSVLLSDQSGAPVAGAVVTFTVTSGGGTITGATATSNASGIATVGAWTLGTAAGANTLLAQTGSLPPVTFSACGTGSHALGSTVDSQLSSTDCRLSDGSFVDFYAVTIPTAGTYIFNQTSSTFDTYIAFLTSANVLVGINDDYLSTSTDSRLKVIVPAGSYFIGANAYDPNTTGNYSLSSAASTAEVANCEDVFVVPGITTPQSLATTDCSTNGFFSDEYVIFLNPGQSVTVAMTSSTLDSYVEIRSNGSPVVLASNDDIDGTTKDARVTYAVPNTGTSTGGFFIVAAASRVAGATGAYTLSVQ
jgi:hypothetical protein